jgi:hypothetical protein
MVLGAVLHHDRAACDGGALGGSDKAVELLNRQARTSYNLDAWKHLKAREGQFGAAYKASLINLGLFADESDEVEEEASEESQELDEEVQAVQVTELSDRGKRLADAYRRALRGTGYVKERWTLLFFGSGSRAPSVWLARGLVRNLAKGRGPPGCHQGDTAFLRPRKHPIDPLPQAHVAFAPAPCCRRNGKNRS